MEQTGRLEHFRKVARKEQNTFEGYCFNDSDVYKWLEAAAYALALKPDAKTQQNAEEAIKLIQQAQEPDGYLNTFFQLNHPDKKWVSLASMHEMYCGGHLIEAAVAWNELHGEPTLLAVAMKWADLLESRFGPNKTPGYPGHEEVELALFKLATLTGQEKYAELARYFLQSRGTRPSVFEQELENPQANELAPYTRKMFSKDGVYSGEYCQDHAPLLEHTEVVGHAVRAMYLYIAATEHAIQTQDPQWLEMLERVWNNLVHRRLYITGGLGPSGANEGFTADFDLPNLTAYAETCASIGLILWAAKMTDLTGSSDYVDVLERSLYNAFLSGIGLDGASYFYDNPLESRGQHKRTPWFICACCPPNVARLIGLVGQFALRTEPNTLVIDLPIAGEYEANLDVTGVHAKIESNYPWSGKFTITLQPAQASEFDVKIRIPEWSADIEVEVPGLEQPSDFENGYAVISKLWKLGDKIEVTFEMLPTWFEANPKVRDDLGRVALMNGPVVYAAERSLDNPFAPQLFAVDLDGEPKPVQGQGFQVEGVRELEENVESLYAPVGEAKSERAQFTLIPYYTWANAPESAAGTEMQVWLRKL
jgi:DUF1680 family protein